MYLYYFFQLLDKLKSHSIPCIVYTGFRGQSHIYYVPHRAVIGDQILREHGVFDSVEIHELNLGFVATDADVLSLQLPNYYTDINTNGDNSCISYVANR